MPAGGQVLDAACGTGKYWPALLGAALQVMGIDQSAGTLGQATRKHPGVAVRVPALQDLMGTTDLLGRYDGLLCVEVLECVAPERWPGVAAGLVGAMRAGAPAYMTVELRSGPLPAASDPRQMPGEVIEGGGYHYLSLPAAGPPLAGSSRVRRRRPNRRRATTGTSC